MGHFHDVAADLRQPTRDLRDLIPDTWSGFAAMHRAAVAEGALSTRIKEVIAVAIAAVKECDGCIAYHTRAAARAGATRQEVAEALGVVLLMDGGPGTVYGPRALAAYDEFAAGPAPAAPPTA